MVPKIKETRPVFRSSSTIKASQARHKLEAAVSCITKIVTRLRKMTDVTFKIPDVLTFKVLCHSMLCGEIICYHRRVMPSAMQLYSSFYYHHSYYCCCWRNLFYWLLATGFWLLATPLNGNLLTYFTKSGYSNEAVYDIGNNRSIPLSNDRRDWGRFPEYICDVRIRNSCR